MPSLARKLYNRVRGRREFPPYRLLDSESLRVSKDRYRKLENIYHAGQRQAWDGRRVLAELIEKHGGIAPLPLEHKQAIGRLFNVILWGEFAAWIVSAELADHIDDTEAKMAATSQAMDEARHFYVMRDYLLELGCELPPIDGLSKAVLTDLISTQNLLHKLVGMQLLVESSALTLFRMVADGVQEPVLRDLMAYFQKDEARHIGLGVQYLPHLLKGLGRFRILGLKLYQWKIITLMSFGLHFSKDDFITLGLDWRESIRHGIELQGNLFRMITEAATGAKLRDLSEGERKQGAGWIWVPRSVRDMNKWSVAQLFPADDAELPAWHRATLVGCREISLLAEKALRFAT